MASANSKLLAAVRKIQSDSALSDKEKARKRQGLLAGGHACKLREGSRSACEEDDNLNMFKCAFCLDLLDTPVTTPCGHNFCMKCFMKWRNKNNITCITCRFPIPATIVLRLKGNSALAKAIRIIIPSFKNCDSSKPCQPQHLIRRNDGLPEKAFTTHRAKKSGIGNASSGRIFVSIPSDHFGPILPEHDERRNLGVLVGESWEDRLECRQWGAHFPHLAGIAGQKNQGAQSVVLSGVHDNEDHGDWFIYTGSGGTDLRGNKRTSKERSSDQQFKQRNQALRVSCWKGYPVRVVRSNKRKGSSYAPKKGVRYDGIYRVEKCWRIVGNQGFKICRYLFVRCDNAPAPWNSGEKGDLPSILPEVKELEQAIDVSGRMENPAWDYDEREGWKWMRTPPTSLLCVKPRKRRCKKRADNTVRTAKKLLARKDFKCLICKNMLMQPVTTSCGHNFCRDCLVEAYSDKPFVRQRMQGDRMLRSQRINKECPSCSTDISDILHNPKVNKDLCVAIKILKCMSKEDEMAKGSKMELGKSEGDREEAECRNTSKFYRKRKPGIPDHICRETMDSDGLVQCNKDGADRGRKKVRTTK